MKALKEEFRKRNQSDEWDKIYKGFTYTTKDGSNRYNKPKKRFNKNFDNGDGGNSNSGDRKDFQYKKKFNNSASSNYGNKSFRSDNNNGGYKRENIPLFKPEADREESTPEIIYVTETKNDEGKTIYNLKLLTTGKGIPVTTEFATDSTSRFVIFMSGDFKRPVWTPKETAKNGVQALIPLAVKNLIVEYDKSSDVVVIYKIIKIDPETRSADMILYNKYENGAWIKPLFDTLSSVEQLAKEKIENKLECFIRINYKPKNITPDNSNQE